jgi:phosphoribosylanthranilate isomerase
MVNPTLDEARAAAKVAGIDALQLHGDESLDFCAALVRDGAVEIIKALPLRSVGDFEKISEYEKTGVSAVLVDADAPGEFGGTGRVIDWRLAAELAAGRLRIPLILSGGLHSENVAEAVETVRPYAVDVASGVEAETPRRKDAVRMNAFLAAVGLGFQNLRLGKSTE